MNLAVLYSSAGRNEEAETLLREVLEAYPEEAQAAYSLGLLLAEMGRLDEAVVFLGGRRRSRARPDPALTTTSGSRSRPLGRIDEAEACPAAGRRARAGEPRLSLRPRRPLRSGRRSPRRPRRRRADDRHPPREPHRSRPQDPARAGAERRIAGQSRGVHGLGGQRRAVGSSPRRLRHLVLHLHGRRLRAPFCCCRSR